MGPGDRPPVSARALTASNARALLLGLLAAAAGCLAAALLISPRAATTAPAVHRVAAPTQGGSWAQVPVLAQLAISRALGVDDHAYWAQRTATGAVARNRLQGLTASFAAGGVTLAAPRGGLALSLREIRAGAIRLPVPAASPSFRKDRVSYDHGPVREWYANGPLGLEQGFSVQRALAPHASTLSLSLSLSGSLRATVLAGGSGLDLRTPGGALAVRYSHLSAFDARGRALATWMSLAGGRVTLHVRTVGARYPIAIDPIFQEGQLSASDGAAFEEMGTAVAISGSTIVVGASGATISGGAELGGKPHPQGAVYVFTEPGGGWGSATQTARLLASDADREEYSGNVYGDGFGQAVAISGQTIVVGAASATEGEGVSAVTYAGKAYVFVEPGGGWVNATQNAELGPTDATQYNYFGSSIATDGATVLVGDPSPQPPFTAGEAYVFAKPGGGWSSETETAKLRASDGVAGDAFGRGVAIAGNVAMVGAPYAKESTNAYQGAVYAFTKAEGKTWGETAQAKLTAGEGKEHETLGVSLALEGATLVAGAPNDANPGSTPSAAYVFLGPGGAWANTSSPAARLTPSDPLGGEHFGGSVGISGKSVVVGAKFAAFEATAQQGAVYVYTEPGGGWTSTSTATKISASGGGIQQAASVGVSGTTIVEGANYAKVGSHEAQGAAYVFGGVNSTPCSAPPAIKEQPTNQLVTAPGEASFTVKEGTVPALCSAASIQWQRSSNKGSTWTNIPSATSATLKINPTAAAESGDELRAALSNANAASPTYSNPATLTVNGSKEEHKEEHKEETKTTTPMVGVLGETTLHYVPKPTYIPPELGWGDVAAGLFGIEPGSEQTVNWGQFVFIARCKNPAGCKGSATLTGTGAGHTTAASAKAKAPPVYSRVAFSVAGNKSKSIVLKLSKAAGATLKKKHKLSGVLTVTVSRPGAAPAKLSHALTIHLVSKRKH